MKYMCTSKFYLLNVASAVSFMYIRIFPPAIYKKKKEKGKEDR